MEISQPQFQLNLDASSSILPFQGDVFFHQGFFSESTADRYLSTLLTEIAWRQDPIVIFGRSIMQPRLTAWYGDAGSRYTYSGITMTAHAWTDTLLEIKTAVESLSNVKFSSVLLNYYRDEKDSMGWHRDNERELGPNPVIASVSIGATRKFQFRLYHDKKIKRSVELTHGSVLLMRGDTQHYWEHSIPKTKQRLGPRINLTFRVI